MPGMSSDGLIKKAEQIRIMEHRLRQNLRLKSQAEIIEFVHDKGLVSVLGGNELPSIISAVMGKPWKPSAKGFKSWLDWWSLKIEGRRVAQVIGEIERRNDILATRIIRRTKTFVSENLWPILDPIVRHQRELLDERKILSSLDLKMMKSIESNGSTRTDRLREELKLEGKANNSKFHQSLNHLESYGLIVGFEDPKPERHIHANIWQSWQKRTSGKKPRSTLPYREALVELVGRVLDSCVLIPQSRIHGLFNWTADIDTAKQDLLRRGDAVQADSYLVATRILG